MRPLHLPALATLALLSACSQDQSPTTPTAGVAGIRAPASNPTPVSISLEKIGQYAGGGAGAAEITAYDEVSKRLFVVNGARGDVDVLDLRNPASPKKVATIPVTQFGGSANSVSAKDGLVAIAIEADPKQNPGTVAFYRATTLQLVSTAEVGALPDMLTFTKSGRYVLVANEGEPSADYLVDPEGSVSIIDVSNVNAPVVTPVRFTAYNGQEVSLRAQGIRIFGPNASAAQDFEPEYIAVDDDETTAWVTLQENNALAIIDLASASVTRIAALGYKNHGSVALDASDRDGPAGAGMVNIRTWNVPLFGMYQPDAIAAYSVNGQTYLVTANEGDAREYLGTPGFTEERRVSTLPLNASIFTAAACGGTCNAAARLGRLNVTNTLGLNGSAYDALYAFGARSFSIWTADGQLVWDSGDQLEQLAKALPMVNFNASNTGNTLDDRSDNKGPEPEGVALGRLGEKTFAFIGLERVGGVVVYDVTVPTSPVYVTYVNTRNGAAGDLGPEGVAFVPSVQSPSKEPLLIVGNEISGTTAIFRIALQ